MYRLYYAPSSYAMPVHALLEEIGAPYELVRVDLTRDRPREPAYLKLNPWGKVPTLADENGVIYESGAIALYLTDRHPEARMGPGADDAQRGLYLQWLFHLIAMIQPLISLIYYPDRYGRDPAATATIEERATARLEEAWRKLDAALTRGPYLLGERYSAADIFLTCQTVWNRGLPDLLARFPHVARCTRLVRDRPAVARVLRIHGVA